MEFALITPIRGLKMTQEVIDLPFGRITSSYEQKIVFINDARTKLYIGQHIYNEILNSPCLIILHDHTSPFFEDLNKLGDFRLIIDQYLELSINFLNTLWIVKDNSINIMESLLVQRAGPKTHISFHFSVFLDCNRNTGITEYNDSEIELANNYFINYLTLRNKDLSNPYYSKQGHSLPTVDQRYQEMGIRTRALVFLDLARQSSNIMLRIANYISFLEVLFGLGSRDGIMQKICDRTSVYIAYPSLSRKELVEKLKIAYDIRSRYVHGDKNNYSFEVLSEYSQFLDTLIRHIMVKLLTDNVFFERSNKAIKNELNKIIDDLEKTDS